MSPDTIPTPSAGFLYEPSTGEWEGPKAYTRTAPTAARGATGTPEQGTTILLDVGKTRMPLEDARVFARMLTKFVERHDTPLK